MDYLQHSDEQIIDKKVYMNGSWWIIDEKKLVQQLENCLAKRGIRERSLAKNLLVYKEQLNDDEKIVRMKTLLESDENDVVLDDDDGDKKLKLNFKQKLITSIDDFDEFLELNERRFKQSEREILDLVYLLEDRIFNANLQLKNAQKNKSDRDDCLNSLEMAKKRLVELEVNIERRYLKAPFIRKKNKIIIKRNNNNNNNSEDEESSSSESECGGGDNENMTIDVVVVDKPVDSVPLLNATIQLNRWRKAVNDATSASQLSICIEQLDNCIAWDKSIMKVICQICNYDDNEDKLLLCDNCDCGYHTYCFKPVLKRVPDGNWYCFVCISKSKSEKLCFVCGSNSTTQSSDLVKCDKCVKLFHTACLPQARAFKSCKWLCLTCAAV